jgi:hypothetical protein
MGIKKRDILLWAIILVPYLSLIPASFWYFSQLRNIENSSFIIINKADYTLSHYNYKGELLQKSQLAYGKNPGNKSKIGDLKTPEGVFKIAGIEDASTWSHDFKGDSLGAIGGAYGPYFVRLDVPGQKGIGIHGTHDNNSIGTRASEGCIRMHNEDITELVKNLNTASIVVIVPGIDDQKENQQLLQKTKTTPTKAENIKEKPKVTAKKKKSAKAQTNVKTKK